MSRMDVWLQNFQGGQSSSKYPTYIVQFMISPQMRFSWPKKWEKQSFSKEKMVVWLHNFLGGLSSSKYTILNHFWLGQLKPPRLTQCGVSYILPLPLRKAVQTVQDGSRGQRWRRCRCCPVDLWRTGSWLLTIFWILLMMSSRLCFTIMGPIQDRQTSHTLPSILSRSSSNFLN